MKASEAFYRCRDEGKRIPKLEIFILNDYGWSFLYARDIIKGPWKKGEKIILTNSKWSYHYSHDIICGSWPEAEKIISEDPEYSYRYAINVIKCIFPLGHPVIFNSVYKDAYIDYLKSINYDLSQIGEWLI